MIRFTAAFLAFALGATPAMGEDVVEDILNAAPVAPSLRQNVVVSDELVRIGDLVENSGAMSHIAIFRAPDPGSTGAVPVARVLEALRPHDIFALDTKGMSEIVVTRAGRTITAKTIEELIARTVSSQYRVADAQHIAVTFDREIATLQVEANLSADLAVSRLSYDSRSGRFDAMLELRGSSAIRRGGLRVTGVALEAYQTAVLARQVARGEVLRDKDIVIERRPRSEIGADHLIEAKDIIGLAPRQPMRAGQMLRRADLIRPDLVRRNEPVMLVFEGPGMMLTMRGTATESGALGDLVSVTNAQSKRTVQGFITGPGRVTISGPVIHQTASLDPSDITGSIRRAQ